jgi:diguanylate cyclase (GGDEF)-like protein
VEREVDDESEFFIVGSTDGLDVKERIATHLDAALFESVIAAEVRRLGTCESFDRLVDLLSQFASQVSKYRWLALMRHTPGRLGIHSNPAAVESSLAEARRALGASADLPTCSVVDEDAFTSVSGSTPVVFPIHFSDTELGRLALAPCVGVHADDTRLARTIAYELGGALRMASLVEESQLMATTDPLTGLLNRRAFMHAAGRELARAARYEDSLSAILLDVDHFKRLNDDRGHAAGDLVLSKVGRLLAGTVRSCDIVARWGGEEFVIALPSTPPDGAALLAERLRVLLQEHEILDAQATPIPVTASFGVAGLVTGDSLDQLIDRADRAMYAAKTNGRNRIHLMQCVRDSALQLSQTAE